MEQDTNNNEINVATPTEVEGKKDEIATDGNSRKLNYFKIAAMLIILVLVGAAIYFYKGLVIAATVNGSPISRLSVIHELESHNGQDVLDLLINQSLITQEARAKNVFVSDSEIQEVMDKYEKLYGSDGNSLDDTLKAQKLTREDLRKQVILQKEVEKILSDKVSVTDDEAKKFAGDNKVTLQPETEKDTLNQIKEEIKQQKLGMETEKLITDLRAKAKIHTFVTY